MAQINPYLTFKGNCREAMTFYQQCFGGSLSVKTVGESPMAAKMPQDTGKIMHSSIIKDNIVLLMGSDLIGTEGLIKGNNVTLSVNCSSEAEIRSVFEKLSQGSLVAQDLKEEFWGGIFGDLTDKYGFRWILNYQKNQN